MSFHSVCFLTRLLNYMETNFKLNIQPVLEADNYKNFLVQNSKACLIYVRKNISVIKNIRLYNFFLK